MRASRLTVAGIGIALLSLAVFAFFLYQGLTSTSTHCGVVPCPGATAEAGASGSVAALSDYLYGVTALLVGQVALAAVILLKRSSGR